MRATGRIRLIVIVVISLLLGSISEGEPVLAQQANRDSRVFQKLLTTVELLDPFITDGSGLIEPAPDRVSFDPVGATAADFGLRIAFQAATESASPWDFGLAFRVGEDGEHFRFVVDSDGSWNSSLGASSPEISGNGIDIAPGGERGIVLDLYAIGSVGYVGIDGEFLTSLALDDIGSPGGFAVGSGFSADTPPDAAVVSYESLTIWRFDQPLNPPGTILRSDISSGSPPADQLRTAGIASEFVEPAVGPDSGLLQHSEDRATVHIAGVDFDDSLIHLECLPPAEFDSEDFDCGILIRVRSEEELLRLVVVSSDQSWWLLDGVGEVVDSGIASSERIRERIAVDLLVNGATGFFSVNGQFVSEIDLSSAAPSGDIAAGTGFFADTFLPGSATPFENFSVWSIGEGSEPVATSSPQPAAIELGDAVENGLYESPRYGHEVSIPAGWAVELAESDRGVDYLQISRYPVNVEIFGFGGTETADECVDFRRSTLEREEGIESVRDLTPLLTSGEAAVQFVEIDFTDEQVVPVWTEIWCARIDDSSLVRFEQTAPAHAFAATIPVHVFPDIDLSLPGTSQDVDSGEQGTAATPVAPQESLAGDDPFADVETTEAAREAVFGLQGENIEGFGVVIRVQRTVDVVAVVVGAAPGDELVIRPGSCSPVEGDMADVLRIDDIDDQGLATGNVDIRLTELINTGDYVAELYAADQDEPIACGAIVERSQ